MSTSAETYRDHKQPNLLERRRREIGGQMAEIYRAVPDFLVPQRAQLFRGIIEIGSGMGAVTEELNRLFPNSPVTAIDNDFDPAIAEAAKRNGAGFIEQDATEISEEAWTKLIEANDVDQIVAMRTSGEVVTQMIATLRKIGFKGMFIFSLLGSHGQLDDATIADINRKKEGIRVPLREDHFYTETAYAYPFV